MAEKIPKPKNRREKEEQYFAEQEQKKRAELRNKLSKEREAKKESQAAGEHWMKCPKCGGDLEEIGYEDVMVDKCKGCSGIYLDAGELELLLDGRNAKGFITKFMSSLSGSAD